MKAPEILYEDNHLIAIHKPHGMLAQGDVTGDDSAFDWVKEYIRVKYEKPGNIYLALLHRLDRPTAGVMIFAKTGKAAARMNELFQKRKVRKVYWARVERVPDTDHGELRHWMKQLESKNIMKAWTREVKGSKEAVLEWRILKRGKDGALLEVRPRTGRKHQIRVQLSEMGCVIRGDMKYGKTTFNPDKNICLLAKELHFTHPVTKEEVRIIAQKPEGDWWNVS